MAAAGARVWSVLEPARTGGENVSSWSCPHEVNGLCKKVAGAYCRPGMKGCVLVGKVQFQDGAVPEPRWPPGKEPARRREGGEEP